MNKKWMDEDSDDCVWTSAPVFLEVHSSKVLQTPKKANWCLFDWGGSSPNPLSHRERSEEEYLE